MTERSAKAAWYVPDPAARSPDVRQGQEGRQGRQRNVARGASRDALSRFTLASGTVLLCVVVAWPFLPRLYQGTSSVILHMTEGDGAEAGLRQGILDEGAIQSEMDRLGSQHLAREAMERLELVHDRDFASPGLISSALAALGLAHSQQDDERILEKLRDEITVTRERRSYTMRVAVRDRDATRAAAIANAIVGAYLDDQIDRKRTFIGAATRRLVEREATLRASHNDRLDEIRAFMSETGITDRADGTELQGQLNALSTELAQARARRIDARVHADALRDMAKAGGLANAPEVVNSPSVQKAREMLAAARAKPAVLASEIASLSAAVDEEARRVVLSAEREAETWRLREDALADALAGIRQDMVARRLNELRLDELRRQAASDETALADAMAKLKGQIGRDQSLQPDADVVARAERPRKAAFPNPFLTAIGALLLACMAGALAVAWPRLHRAAMDMVRSARGQA